MKDYAKILQDFLDFKKQYTVIEGFVEVVWNEHNSTFHISTACDNIEDLVLFAVTETYLDKLTIANAIDCVDAKVEKIGCYQFTGLLSLIPEEKDESGYITQEQYFFLETAQLIYQSTMEEFFDEKDELPF